MKIRTQLFAGKAMVLVLLLGVASMMHLSVRALVTSANWVTHTHQVQTHVRMLREAMVDMQTGQRGFMLTGDATFLEPYSAGQAVFEETLTAAQRLVADNPTQTARIAELRDLGHAWMAAHGEAEIELRRRIDRGELGVQAMAFVLSGRDESGAPLPRHARTGKQLMDELRGVVDEILLTEETLLEQRKRASARAASVSQTVGFVGVGIATLAAVIMGLILMRRLTAQLGAEPEALQQVATLASKGILSQTVPQAARSTGSNVATCLNEMIATFRDAASQADEIAQGNLRIDIAPRSAEDTLGLSLQRMTARLREVTEENEKEHWIKSGQTSLADAVRGEQELTVLAKNIILYLARHTESEIGAIYLDSEGALCLAGTYAYTHHTGLSQRIEYGEGLVGQAAREHETIVLTDVPDDYIEVSSGLGSRRPSDIIVVPLILDTEVIGVLELGSFGPFSQRTQEFLRLVSETVAVAIHSANERTRNEKLLQRTQQLADELQSRQDQLKQSNAELEGQTKILRASEEHLQASNKALEEHTESLRRQSADIERQRQTLETQKRELAETNRYKTEFMSNMSHELRTPLNSMLILSKSLSDNKRGNLTERQVEAARVVHSGGTELLELINELLDLSNVEAGKMQIHVQDVEVQETIAILDRQFRPLATDAGIHFNVEIDPRVPALLHTDSQRLRQILKNLLSNAIKFTREGSVALRVARLDVATTQCICFAVTDTGIGIAEDRTEVIFEAFKQADGSTSRAYGGTGLGLTISRELAGLLGGELALASSSSGGSTFTLTLPLAVAVRASSTEDESSAEPAPVAADPQPAAERPAPRPVVARTSIEPTPPPLCDDRELLSPDRATVLVVEDDPRFAETVYDRAAAHGYNCVVSPHGLPAVAMAQRYRVSAVFVALGLPDVDGTVVLEGLKRDLSTRHVPVCIIAGRAPVNKAQHYGALGFVRKSATPQELDAVFDRIDAANSQEKRVLVVDDDPHCQAAIQELLDRPGLELSFVESGEAALVALRTTRFDCVVVDLTLPKMDGFELLEALPGVVPRDAPPVIVYTGRRLSEQDEARLALVAASVLVKGSGTPDRLIDDVALFLHARPSALPPGQLETIRALHASAAVLRGRRILMVDDDERNLHAIAGLLAEQQGLIVDTAVSGEIAIAKLGSDDYDMVLMDVMMPVMDGLEAIRRIRLMPRCSHVPIVAVTAKAMPNDRSLCIAAGATDYVAKPINLDQLAAVLRTCMPSFRATG